MNKLRSVLPWVAARDAADRIPVRPELRRLRRAVTVFFALDGFVFSGWVVRIPAVKEQTGASAGGLGLALLGVSVGAVVTMTLTGRLCRRFGNHPVTVAAAALLAALVCLPPHTHSVAALAGVLVAFGAAFGAVNVAANSAAVDVVAALGRPVMPAFHAAYSLGGMLGAGLGGLLAGQLSAARHLALVAVAGLVVVAVAGRVLLTSPAPAGGTAAPPGGRPGPAGHRAASGAGAVVAVLGLVGLCTTYGEGALADWSALHLKESLDAGPGLAAAGYAVFALAMTLGRLGGAALLERFGQTRVLVGGGVAAALGMLLAAQAPAAGWALAGFVVTGLGLANVFPIAVGTAGALAGPRGVAATSTLGYGGFLLGPVAIGFLADRVSLAAALTTVAALSALAAVTAWAARGALRAGP
jgi:MFS family permease